MNTCTAAENAETSTGGSVALAILLALAAAFFAVSILLAAVDFGMTGENFLYAWGKILLGGYGISSVLVPAFLCAAAVELCRASWNPRRGVLLSFSGVPFFIIAAAEKMCRHFSTTDSGTMLTVKIFLTLLVAVLAVCVGYLLVAALYDSKHLDDGEEDNRVRAVIIPIGADEIQDERVADFDFAKEQSAETEQSANAETETPVKAAIAEKSAAALDEEAPGKTGNGAPSAAATALTASADGTLVNDLEADLAAITLDDFIEVNDEPLESFGKNAEPRSTAPAFTSPGSAVFTAFPAPVGPVPASPAFVPSVSADGFDDEPPLPDSIFTVEGGVGDDGRAAAERADAETLNAELDALIRELDSLPTIKANRAGYFRFGENDDIAPEAKDFLTIPLPSVRASPEDREDTAADSLEEGEKTVLPEASVNAEKGAAENTFVIDPLEEEEQVVSLDAAKAAVMPAGEQVVPLDAAKDAVPSAGEQVMPLGAALLSTTAAGESVMPLGIAPFAEKTPGEARVKRSTDLTAEEIRSLLAPDYPVEREREDAEEIDKDFGSSAEFIESRDTLSPVTIAPIFASTPPQTGGYSAANVVPLDLLLDYPDGEYWLIDDVTKQAADILQKTLSEFRIDAEVTGIRKGPVITMFEILPAPGVKLSKIVALQDNIALRLAASSVRIIAPIPGKHAVGIEVPNKKRSIVSLREIIATEHREWTEMAIPVVLGKDITGEAKIIDLAKTPHMLIAGATGAGKSVCVNSIILSILFKRSARDVKMILIDPKIVELKLYNDIPHLLTPVITEPKRAFQALQYCLCEMERRYALLDGMGVRDIVSYNRRILEKRIAAEKLPYIVVIIDEFADLMATTGKELESTVARLAAMSRAVGVHLVLATQRPSIDVITGLIKANIPTRVAFMVSSKIDSRIIIDQVGAEKLLGRGDMLYASASDPFPIRIQGTLVSDTEVENVAEYVKDLGEPEYIDDEIFYDDEGDEDGLEDAELYEGDSDPMYEKAVEIVVQAGKASASYIQRKLKLGYNRAARLVEVMEKRGIVGPANGSKARDLLCVP